jgi:DNA-binding MarR family transcriptional regulator
MTYANEVTPATTPRTTAPRPAQLAADLRVALMRSVRRIRQERSSDAITDGQYSVLARLDCEGPSTPRELAAHEQVQPPTMTRTLNALVESGHVTRTVHPSDGRQVLMAVSEQGAREVRETRRRRDAWLTQQLSGLTDAEREVLAQAAEILGRVVARVPQPRRVPR